MSDSVPISPVQNSKIHAALAKAQGAFVQPEKNKENPHFKSWYADLKNVIESFRPHLAANGLSFTQSTVLPPGSKDWLLVLTLRHESGEVLDTSMPINLFQAPQQVGSALTYLRRYQAATFFGIAADDDDDGNAATEAHKKAQQGRQQGPQQNRQSNPPPKPNGQGQPAQRQPQASPPAAKEPPAKGPEDTPQQFPPDDLDQRPPAEKSAAAKKDDAADFIMPFGEDVKGKPLRQIGEAQLKKIRQWTEDQMKIAPPPDGIATIMVVNRRVKEFLKSVGAE